MSSAIPQLWENKIEHDRAPWSSSCKLLQDYENINNKFDHFGINNNKDIQDIILPTIIKQDKIQYYLDIYD